MSQGKGPRSSERLINLARVLNLLPYFEAHPDRTIMEAARDLGQSPAEIMEDLDRLYQFCGLPGLFPGDRVELEKTLTRVTIYDNQGMDKPLRLTQTEAGALLLSLEALENLPGLADQQAVVSAAEKLRAATGASAKAVYDTTAVSDDDDEAEILSTIRTAMDSGRMVRITYHSDSSDSTSTRLVSAAHIFTNEGGTYLTAWDTSRDGHRTFRIDRISDIAVTEDQADPHLRELDFKADDPFNFTERDYRAELIIDEGSLWMADYAPMEVGEQVPGGYAATLPILSRDWFIRFALNNADRITVTGPAELADQVRKRAFHALSAYDQLPK